MPTTSGGVAHMVERSLRMREARGSIPRTSIPFSGSIPRTSIPFSPKGTVFFSTLRRRRTIFSNKSLTHHYVSLDAQFHFFAILHNIDSCEL
jgi:hypothetical protein